MIGPLIVAILTLGDDALHAELQQKEHELVELQRLRRELLGDPAATVVLPAPPTRLGLLRNIDLDAADSLGFGPAQLRARLLSGLDRELRDLVDARPTSSEQGALQRLLELEEELVKEGVQGLGPATESAGS